MWYIGTVVALHDETPTGRTIVLEVPEWPGHLPGQHVDMRLTASDRYSAVRSYSIACAPNPQRRIEIAVEQLPNGEVSPYLTRVGSERSALASQETEKDPDPYDDLEGNAAASGGSFDAFRLTYKRTRRA